MKSRVVVKKDTWLRGTGEGVLLNKDDKKMCCLGFAMLAAGYEAEDILGRARPSEVGFAIDNNLYKKLVVYAGTDDSIFAIEAMSINDDKVLTDEERQQQLTTLFEQYGVELVFE